MKTLLILVLLVFLPSLLLRLHPITSESFAYDAVKSQVAARAGMLANALDSAGTLAARRNHPPLLSYIIELNNRVFGAGPFGARVFSIIFGSLACLVVAVAVAALLAPDPICIPAGVIAGWILCVLPVHLYASRSSNWDAVYGCFATASLLCMALYTARESTRQLYGAALFAVLAFLTCELGFVLAPAALFTLLLDVKRLPAQRVARRWTGVFLFAAALFLLLWPAGLLKLDLGRTLLFRWRDSAIAERNLPWYDLYTELFRQSLVFTVCMVAGIIAAFVLPASRNDRARRVRFVSLPFWIYAATVFVLSLKDRLVYVHHIVDMFPPLIIAVCVELGARAGALGRMGRRWAIGIAAAVVALCAISAFSPDPEVVGPQEHPGFLGVSDVLRNYPGARVYCHDRNVLGFYLPGASIEGGGTWVWTRDDVERAKRGRYDFVVFDRNKLGATYAVPEEIVSALAPEYHVRWVVNHRRTGEPVAWVLAPGP